MKRLTITAVAVSAMSLSGCAQMMNFGDMMWTETKHFTLKTKDTLVSALRPRAPRQDPVFVQAEATPYSDTPLYNYETLSTPELRPQSGPIEIEFYDTASLQFAPHSVEGPIEVELFDAAAPTPTYASNSYEVSSYEVSGGYYTHPAALPPALDYSSTQRSAGTGYYGDGVFEKTLEDQNVPAPYMAQTEMPNLSYVKLSGATQISDWQDCQGQAGGYIQPNPMTHGSTFEIRPDFDYCMRVKGYMPEADAVQFMDSQQLP